MAGELTHVRKNQVTSQQRRKGQGVPPTRQQTSGAVPRGPQFFPAPPPAKSRPSKEPHPRTRGQTCGLAVPAPQTRRQDGGGPAGRHGPGAAERVLQPALSLPAVPREPSVLRGHTWIPEDMATGRPATLWPPHPHPPPPVT